MPRRCKPGDLITMRVLAVEPGLMRVEFNARQFEIQMPEKPMRKKEFLELQREVMRRWREIMGEPMTIVIPAHAPRRYPIKQCEEDRKRLDEEGGS